MGFRFLGIAMKFDGRGVLALLIVLLYGPGVRAFWQEEPNAPESALRASVFEPLPLGSIRPAGWLKDQLRIQAEGLSGHLDEIWPDIKNSAWFGGSAEGWERVPYWLDGMVPLAFEADDPVLKAKVGNAIEYILAHQQGDGWLGPVGDSQKHKPYDVWPLFPLFKALAQYEQATGDRRIVPALLRCCRKIDQVITRDPLYSWAKVRAADLAVTLYWLYLQTGELWVLDLARKAFAQSQDWRALYENFPYKDKAREKKSLENHGVNTAMALKYGGVRHRLSGDAKDKTAIFSILEILDRYHGQPTGIFTCDEHLAGRSPSQGTELCTVVEAMYSLEIAAAIIGDARLGDRLEMLAFNALPATFKKDMTAHQYDQQCNQVVCTAAGEHVYVSNEADSNLYGLEPNFGCCTANMHQGWPKFASQLWMKSSDGGLAAIAYAPCVITTVIEGNTVRVEVVADSSYPFGDAAEARIVIKVQPVVKSRFSLHLRIPSWGEGVTCGVWDDATTFERINDLKAGSFLTLNREWGVNPPAEINITVPMPVRLREEFNHAVSIQRGPVIYALLVDPEWKMFKDRPGSPFDDWEVFPKTPWNYALEIDRDHPERAITFEARKPSGPLFTASGAPLAAKVKGRRLPEWKLEKGAAAPPPSSPVVSQEPLEELLLVPYGSTDLRVSVFPTLASP
jgi:hypothetical protein